MRASAPKIKSGFHCQRELIKLAIPAGFIHVRKRYAQAHKLFKFLRRWGPNVVKVQAGYKVQPL
jgi:hypothetical protein